MSTCRPEWTDCHWVVFDAVGTLIDPSPSVAEAYQAIGARHGARETVETVRQRFRRAFAGSETPQCPDEPQGPRQGQTSETLELARWRWIVGQVFPDLTNVEECFRELWDHFARPDSWRCFDDTGPVVTQLIDAGYRVAIASNFDQRLHAICEAFPSLRAVPRIVSTEVGHRKPSPDFYEALIGRCGCAPQQILMVGDEPAHDLVGPRAAGLQALHLRRGANASELTPHQIESLCRLTEHLAS